MQFAPNRQRDLFLGFAMLGVMLSPEMREKTYQEGADEAFRWAEAMEQRALEEAQYEKKLNNDY